MRHSTPSSAFSSVVESSQPDDGGRSTTLLLVAFPLPSRSLLAGPDAAISPRTRTKNRLVLSRYRPAFWSCLIFTVPSKKKIPNDEDLPGTYVSFARKRKVLVLSVNSCSRNTRRVYTCEFAFQVPVDVRTVVSWGISEELAEPRETGLILFSPSFRSIRYKLCSPLSQGLRNRRERFKKKFKKHELRYFYFGVRLSRLSRFCEICIVLNRSFEKPSRSPGETHDAYICFINFKRAILVCFISIYAFRY